MGRVATADAQRFMMECLKAVGAGCAPAIQQAELLIEADKIGHPSHGLNRIEVYVNDIVDKRCMPNNAPMVLNETEATAWVDANDVLGATASHFCMDLAIKKALKAGVGWVSVKGSNHFGMAGFWAKKAANQGLIGLAFTNAPPLLAPTRSRESALGTNPLACVAPGLKNDFFYLDMATSAVSFGKIEMQHRKGEPLPAGWAQGPNGKETLDADLALKSQCLIPLGGCEITSGYKGYGLAAMVDLFSGILGGARYGHHIQTWGNNVVGEPANYGHCFVAVNPECFAPRFRNRVSDSLTHWRQLTPTHPALPVLAPGDKEKRAGEETDAQGYVTYVKQQLESSALLALKLKIKPMKVLVEKS